MESKRLKAILQELRSQLFATLGEKIAALILYGSQARGDARDDSDIDVLIVLKDEFSYAEMLNRTITVSAGLSLENDVVISRAFVSRKDFENKQIPFLINVRRDGVAFTISGPALS